MKKRTSYQRSLHHRGKEVSLTIVRQRRKTLAIHVFPGNRPIELRAPLKCPWYEIETFLTSRQDWIIRSLDELAEEPNEPEVLYRPGELHFYLGETYPLALSKGRAKVALVDGKLLVSCAAPGDPAVVRKQIEKFYRQNSLAVFTKRMDVCLRRFPLEVTPSGLRVRKMRSRWGSCSANGWLCFNTLLVQKPVSVIDFVITHELCHLVHFGHNRPFYKLMDEAMPDWRNVEKQLLRTAVEPCQLELF